MIYFKSYNIANDFIEDYYAKYPAKGLRAPHDVYTEFKNHKRDRKFFLEQLNLLNSIVYKMNDELSK